MKVLLISNMYPERDSHFGIFVKTQVQALQREGVEIFLAVRTQNTTIAYVRFIFACFWSLLFKHYDVVHAHYGFHSALLPAVFKRKPLILTFHGSDAQVEPFRNRMYYNLHRYVLRRCDRIVTVSKPIRNLLVGHFGSDANTISVISCGVDTRTFQPLEKHQAARKLGFPTNSKIVLYTGKLDYMKGVDLLYTCAECMRDILFVFAGSGNLKCDLPNCRFLGPISHQEMPFWMNLADVFVLPSRSEGTPVVLLEAFACGTPVVTSDVGGCPDLVQDGFNGFVFPSGEMNSLREKLAHLLESDSLRRFFATNGRTIAVERFDNAIIAKKILDVYSALTNK